MTERIFHLGETVDPAEHERTGTAIEYEGDVIWGLTLAILEDFLAVLALSRAGGQGEG